MTPAALFPTGTSVELAGLADELEFLEAELAAIDGIVVTSADLFDSQLASSTLDTILVSLASGSSILAFRAIATAWIKGRATTVVVRVGTDVLRYEGPSRRVEDFERLIDGLKVSESPSRGVEHAVSPVPRINEPNGPDAPDERDAAGGQPD